MWEFCVCAKKENKNVILYLESEISPVLKKLDGVKSLCERENFVSFCVGIKQEHSTVLKKELLKLLCNAICEKMKYNFLKENIKINISEKSLFDAFIKVYTYFDIELEKAIVIRAIYFPKNLNLESFLNFRLHSLKQKWQEMCDLTNLNASIFLKSKTFLDILKFLIDNLDYKHESIVLDFKCNKIFLDSEKKSFCDLTVDSFDVLTKIIELSPKKIKIITGVSELEPIGLLVELFDGRVEFIKS